MSDTVPIPVDLDSDMKLWSWVGLALTGKVHSLEAERTRRVYAAYLEVRAASTLSPGRYDVGGALEALVDQLTFELTEPTAPHALSTIQAMRHTLAQCFRAAYDAGPGWLCDSTLVFESE